ncbi:hypothetical protein DICPUDRAFT_99766 [Dictyostelium purpureum]|uniref:Uncharacterized protein n=1 Tax=Dictyostelium purpureum TaxID=5786 RepID=F1A2D3_DICPU|nr:uncharacterized protein DICPUDRAFT_99766 [Dictyostelium purpureum]EGC29642.1 hypothetical protein DICPUDRAFT_99766 [Dictyostelium purpureum]|eukprot:XP_003293829.1 hypothetical protein DICPUDRAFT_99766 [Dictyostelium purpureum]
MVKVKSVKIYTFIDDEDGNSELFWLNGQLINHTAIEYMVRACNGLNNSCLGGRKFKKIKVKNKTKKEIVNQSKLVLREYIRKKTRNGKLTLKNFTVGQCHCDLCVNELPIIIQQKKSKFPKNENEWFDYLRVIYFCIIKQQKYVIDVKEPKDDESNKFNDSSSEEDDDDDFLSDDDDQSGSSKNGNSNGSSNSTGKMEYSGNQENRLNDNINNDEEGENDENDNFNRFQDGKEYFVYTKDLFEFLFVHRKLLEIEGLFKKYSTSEIKKTIISTLCYWQNTFKNGKQVMGVNGYWTLVDVKDDPWYDIDIPSDEGESRKVNGKSYKICGVPTPRGKCQRIGTCPTHPKINHIPTSKNIIPDEFNFSESSQSDSDDSDRFLNNSSGEEEEGEEGVGKKKTSVKRKVTESKKSTLSKTKLKSKSKPNATNKKVLKTTIRRIKSNTTKNGKSTTSKTTTKIKNNNNNKIGNKIKNTNNNNVNNNNDNIIDNLNEENLKKIKVKIDQVEEEIENEIEKKSIPGGLCKNLSPLKMEKEILDKFSFSSILEQADLVQYKDRLPKEYVRFMILKVSDNDHLPQTLTNEISLHPPPLIHKLWLFHISNTKKYKEFCELLGGSTVSCNPQMVFESKDSLAIKYERLKELYVYSFGNFKFYSKKSVSAYNDCFKSNQDIWVDPSQL